MTSSYHIHVSQNQVQHISGFLRTHKKPDQNQGAHADKHSGVTSLCGYLRPRERKEFCPPTSGFRLGSDEKTKQNKTKTVSCRPLARPPAGKTEARSGVCWNFSPMQFLYWLKIQVQLRLFFLLCSDPEAEWIPATLHTEGLLLCRPYHSA